MGNRTARFGLAGAQEVANEIEAYKERLKNAIIAAQGHINDPDKFDEGYISCCEEIKQLIDTVK